MLSKNRIKQINALQQKKFRNESRTFVAEGHKVVAELLRSSLKIREIFATEDWASENAHKYANTPISVCSADEIKKVSAMQTACNVVAEVEMRPDTTASALDKNALYLAMDSVRDPGNLGTIIRIANWFGIDTILASSDCVDLYNPKVIQASMGSAFRVNVVYCNLPEKLQEARALGMPVYGTFLNGDNIYRASISPNGIIVLGNEGHGILPDTEALITNRLYIPTGAPAQTAPESLNVSTATAVVCSEFFRRRIS
ncbi:MAG: RNA methyltransferase [Bacteroidales bacterium]|nr:RNA methyltransferase [Bacteroidales bacterium]